MTAVDATRLYEIEARAAAATGGPWKVWAMQVLADPVGNSDLADGLPIADTTDPHRGFRTWNADFIAAARADVPDLCEAVRDAWAENGRLRTLLAEVAELHQPYGCTAAGEPEHETCGEREWCYSCGEGQPWPCPTFQAIRDGGA